MTQQLHVLLFWQSLRKCGSRVELSTLSYPKAHPWAAPSTSACPPSDSGNSAPPAGPRLWATPCRTKAGGWGHASPFTQASPGLPPRGRPSQWLQLVLVNHFLFCWLRTVLARGKASSVERRLQVALLGPGLPACGGRQPPLLALPAWGRPGSHNRLALRQGAHNSLCKAQVGSFPSLADHNCFKSPGKNRASGQMRGL